MTPEYEKLLNERNDHILEKMSDNHKSVLEKLSDLSKQTDKLDKKTEDINTTIQGLILTDSQHYVLCPNTIKIPELDKKIDRTKEEIENKISMGNAIIETKWEKFKHNTDETFQDVTFFIRNPKLAVWILAAAFFVIFFTIYEVYQTIENVDTDLRKHKYYQRDETDPVILRGGTDNKDTNKQEIIKKVK